MKHPITIDGKKYNIKPISELTTAEFIELEKIEDLDYLKYISWQTGVSIDKTFYAIIDPKIYLAIGQKPDITKMKIPDWVDKNKKIDTVGLRHQVESSKLKNFDLLVLCLAVAQARSNNYEDVQNLIDQYMQMPFAEVLPSGFFFFKNYNRGKSNVRNFLNWLLALIRIRK